MGLNVFLAEMMGAYMEDTSGGKLCIHLELMIKESTTTFYKR